MYYDLAYPSLSNDIACGYGELVYDGLQILKSRHGQFFLLLVSVTALCRCMVPTIIVIVPAKAFIRTWIFPLDLVDHLPK